MIDSDLSMQMPWATPQRGVGPQLVKMGSNCQTLFDFTIIVQKAS